MPAPSQQRSARNRRAVSASQPAVIPTLAMQISGTTGPAIKIRGYVWTLPPAGSGQQVNMVLVSVPQIRRTGTASFPVSATINATRDELTLTYAAPDIGPGETFDIGSQDPSVRTATGGFMGSGLLQVATNAMTPLAYSASSAGSTTTLFGPMPTSNDSLFNRSGWKVNGATNLVSVVDWQPTQITLHWSSFNVNPGDTIEWAGPELTTSAAAAFEPDRAPVVSA